MNLTFPDSDACSSSRKEKLKKHRVKELKCYLYISNNNNVMNVVVVSKMQMRHFIRKDIRTKVPAAFHCFV